jgi:AraC family transcriptional regulator
MKPLTGSFGDPEAPDYSNKSRRVRGQLVMTSLKVQEVEYVPGSCVGRHAHATANLLYIIKGAHWSGHSRGGERCVPQTVRFLPAGEPHENYFPVGSTCLNVELSPSILDRAREHGAILRGSGEVASPSAGLLGTRLYREFHQKDDMAEFAMEEAALKLLLSGVRPTTPPRGPSPAWLLRVREMLYEHGTGRLTLDDLSRCAGRHPVQVSRRFHHHFGCTISVYVRQLRIARAQVLLSRPDMSVADIALASGFADQSHFTNVFRRLTGVPPHRWRSQHSRT